MFCRATFVTTIAIVAIFCSLINARPIFAQIVSSKATTAETPVLSSGSNAVGDAFRTIFNPASANRVRTMGSIQRTSFLDELLANRGRLQVAFVIDGTESMEDQLKGIQSTLGAMIGDLRRVVGKGLEVQMILYRDSGAPSGAISWPIGKDAWTTDDNTIRTGLAKLVPESGAPYFYEQIDAGLYAALNLPWAQDDEVNRWIFLIGDAPPFQNGFSEPDNQAVRQYETELLKKIAHEKKIRIHGMLCPSRELDKQVYEKVLPESESFFKEITDATNGFFLNLSDPAVLRKVQEAAVESTEKFVTLKPILQRDIDVYKEKTPPVQKGRVAVLPFLEIEKMDFDPNNPMTQLAEEVRSQLDQKGIETRAIWRVRDEFTIATTRRRRITSSALPQYIGEKLNVDYVIWRHPAATSGGNFQAEVYDVRKGKAETVSEIIDLRGISSNSKGPLNVNLCSLILKSLASKSQTSSQPVAKLFTDGKFQTRLVSLSNEGEQPLQSARLYLQQALDRNSSLGGVEDVELAEKELLSVEGQESGNALWNNLFANVCYVKALQTKNSNSKSSRNFLSSAKKFGEAAFKSRDTNTEFEADHWFFQKEFDKAITAYESIISTSLSPDTIVRARWMLFFIYIGDWDSKIQKLDKAREHAIALMATYPEARETKALMSALHWDPSQGKTLLTAIPISDASPSDEKR